VVGDAARGVQNLEFDDGAGGQHTGDGQGLEHTPRIGIAPGEFVRGFVEQEQHRGESGHPPRLGSIELVHIQLSKQVEVRGRPPPGRS
jgi:hypothetical protein